MRASDGLWPILNRVMQGHVAIYRATRGRIGHHLPGAPSTLLLDHVGARSQIKRTTPLLYLRDGQDIVIVAAKGGHPKNPAWFHNLRAHPDTTIQVGAEHRPVRARVATVAERARLWPMAVETYSGWRRYQQRTLREIPLVVLEPR